jgi:ABC-type uncharacterized transport system permease subunit
VKLDLRRALTTVAAPVLALLFAMLVTTLILLAAGDPVADVWQVLFSRPKPRNVVNIINNG